MMREVKFRSWLKEVKEMIYDFTINNGEKTETDKNILMQCTGLKDKNGVEIYEGDILKVEHPINDAFSGIFKVELHPESMNYIVGAYNLGSGAYKIGKVIGNIYENTELLDGL